MSPAQFCFFFERQKIHLSSIVSLNISYLFSLYWIQDNSSSFSLFLDLKVISRHYLTYEIASSIHQQSQHFSGKSIFISSYWMITLKAGEDSNLSMQCQFESTDGFKSMSVLLKVLFLFCIKLLISVNNLAEVDMLKKTVKYASLSH